MDRNRREILMLDAIPIHSRSARQRVDETTAVA
jgi:hypothetical protein